MSAEEAVRAAAARYDDGADEGKALAAEALAVLAWRRNRGRVCAGCDERKPLAAFGADTREADGLHRLCRACRSTGPLL